LKQDMGIRDNDIPKTLSFFFFLIVMA
jgi:hypothetical protein